MRSIMLDRTGGKSIAALEIAAFDAALEPTHALFGAAMGETFGHDIALGAFLQRIIPDLRGRIQTFFNVSRFQDVPFFVGEVGPNTGKTVRLQLQPDR